MSEYSNLGFNGGGGDPVGISIFYIQIVVFIAAKIAGCASYFSLKQIYFFVSPHRKQDAHSRVGSIHK